MGIKREKEKERKSWKAALSPIVVILSHEREVRQNVLGHDQNFLPNMIVKRVERAIGSLVKLA